GSITVMTGSPRSPGLRTAFSRTGGGGPSLSSLRTCRAEGATPPPLAADSPGPHPDDSPHAAPLLAIGAAGTSPLAPLPTARSRAAGCQARPPQEPRQAGCLAEKLRANG